MLLAIDIGNTAAKFGFFRGGDLVSKFVHPTTELAGLSGPDAAPVLPAGPVDRIVISSVVDSVLAPLSDGLRDRYGAEPVILDHRSDFGLRIDYRPPGSVGTDRLLAASAASRIYGTPCLVCSLGTATTVDAVSAESEFLGGAIAPGARLLGEALHSETARLPRVEFGKPESPVGRTTADCIRSGIYYGYAGLVRELISRIRSSVPGEPAIVATGGNAEMMADEVGFDIVDPDLVLKGISLIVRG